MVDLLIMDMMENQSRSNNVPQYKVRYYNYLSHKKESVVLRAEDIDDSIKRHFINMAIQLLSVKKLTPK